MHRSNYKHFKIPGTNFRMAVQISSSNKVNPRPHINIKRLVEMEIYAPTSYDAILVGLAIRGRGVQIADYPHPHFR